MACSRIRRTTPLPYAPGSEGFSAHDEQRRRANGGVTKFCVKKPSYMAHD
jgi:hypothetical protein